VLTWRVRSTGVRWRLALLAVIAILWLLKKLLSRSKD